MLVVHGSAAPGEWGRCRAGNSTGLWRSLQKHRRRRWFRRRLRRSNLWLAKLAFVQIDLKVVPPFQRHFALIFDGNVSRYPPHYHRLDVRHHLFCSRQMQELSRVKIRNVKSRLNYGGFEALYFAGMNYRSSPFCRFFCAFPPKNPVQFA